MEKSENNTVDKLLLDFNNNDERYGEEFAEFQNAELLKKRFIDSITNGLIEENINPNEITEEVIDAHVETIVKELLFLKKDVLNKLMEKLKVK